MNAVVDSTMFSIPLDRLPVGTSAIVTGIDSTMLDGAAIRRLQHLGFSEGVAVVTLHQGPIGRDPIAVRVGRMTVAIRRRHASAVHVAAASQA